MKCECCGKELKKVGVLSSDEHKDYLRISEMYSNAQQALKPEVVNSMKFTEGQVFEYFRAAFDEMAKAAFLEYYFKKEITAKYKLDGQYFVKPDTGELYVHKQ